VEVAAVQNSLAHMSMPHNQASLFNGVHPLKAFCSTPRAVPAGKFPFPIGAQTFPHLTNIVSIMFQLFCA
jgi:hypothetical protein